VNIKYGNDTKQITLARQSDRQNRKAQKVKFTITMQNVKMKVLHNSVEALKSYKWQLCTCPSTRLS